MLKQTKVYFKNILLGLKDDGVSIEGMYFVLIHVKVDGIEKVNQRMGGKTWDYRIKSSYTIQGAV